MAFHREYIRPSRLNPGTIHRPARHYSRCFSYLPLSLIRQDIRMPSAALTTVTPGIMSQVDNTLRTLGFDLTSLVKSFDIKTVGLLTLVVVGAIFLFDLISYGYTSYAGTSSSYTSYGRSLVTSAAKVWDQREQLGLASGLRNGRDLDTMTQILDTIADAVIKYDKEEDNEVGQTRKSKDL